jgi:beta-glucosidase/6-phospho-beta-glucosidase/beta-galactosidase
MNMSNKITDEDRSVSKWLAERIRIDVEEEYGIEVVVTCGGLGEPQTAIIEIKDNMTVTYIMSLIQDKPVLKLRVFGPH